MNPELTFGMLSGTPDRWRWIAGVLSLVALALLSVINARRAGACRIATRRLELIRHGSEGAARMTSSRSLGPTASSAPLRKPRALRHVTTHIICAGILNGDPVGVRRPAARVVRS